MGKKRSIKKSIILSLLLILALVLLVDLVKNHRYSIYRLTHDKTSYIEYLTGVSLPEGTEVEKISFNYRSASIEAKIIIPINKTEYIKKEMINRFGETTNEKSYIPNFQNTCDWWDMEKSKIESLIFTFDGVVYLHDGLFHGASTSRQVWVFFMQVDGPNQVVYIVY